MNGAEILVSCLKEQGVDTVFGYPGGSVLAVYDALGRDGSVRLVTSCHEQFACHAADGYARATGRVGVVLATSGPGATNLVTGIANAYMDSTPLIAITGNVSLEQLGRDSFQEIDIAGVTMPITKHNFVVRRVEDLAHTLREAFRIAQTGRKGPVLVDIPKDVTGAITEYVPQPPVQVEPVTSYDQAAVLHAAQLINSASRPLIYFGGGVCASGAGELLRELTQKAQIPATYTLMAAGVMGYGDPLNLGLLGMHGSYTTNKAASQADVLIAIGTRFSDRVALDPGSFAKNAVRIQFDIDASEIGKNVDVDCSVVGDAAVVLKALLPHIQPATHPEWMRQLQSWQSIDYRPKDHSDRLMPHQVIGSCCELAGPDAVYVTDVGQHQMWACQYIRHVKDRKFLTSGGLGTMGFGYGAALGAQAALGRDQTVVMMTGDGSFHMNMNEACTAVSYDLPVITIIFNNQVLGMVRQWQTAFYGKRYSSTDPHRKTDYVKVAEGFGLKGYHCETLDEFRAAFTEALASKKPAWIECMIDKDEKVLPMIPAAGNVEDIMMS